MILTVTAWIVATACVVSGLVVLRAPSSWTRLLAFSLVASKVNLLVIVLALLTEHTFYLDVAIVYTVLSHVGILVLSRYMAGREVDGARDPG